MIHPTKKKKNIDIVLKRNPKVCITEDNKFVKS